MKKRKTSQREEELEKWKSEKVFCLSFNSSLGRSSELNTHTHTNIQIYSDRAVKFVRYVWHIESSVGYEPTTKCIPSYQNVIHAFRSWNKPITAATTAAAAAEND